MTHKIALLFPGQGSQYVGMGRSLLDEFPVARQTFEEASDTLQEDVARLCFDGPVDRLSLTANTQPAILTVSIAAWRVVRSETDLTPVCAAGHSLGEYSALVAADALKFPDAVSLVRQRGQFMQEAVPEGEGTMAALVGLADEEVEELCRQYAGSGVVAPANFNCPGQIVISGDSDAVERVSKAAQGKEGCKTIPLNVSAPFHSPLMVPAGKRLREVLETAEGRELDFDVISNFTADAYPSHDAIPELLTQQVSNPVRWHGCMETVMSRGINLAIELGPKRVLVGLMKRISREMSTVQMEDKKGLKEVLRILNF